MAEIPIELIVEILLRLPVVDLLRFRCVSKEWRNLIDSPNFVKSHLNLPNKPQSVLFMSPTDGINRFDIDSISNANSSLNLEELMEPCSEISVDFIEIYMKNAGFVGHINGLVCCVCDRDRAVILWNPSTRKHIQVPTPNKRFWSRVLFWSWGFGYDRDSDDYKVVALAYLVAENGGSDRNLVWVYSLRSGSWRRNDAFPHLISCFTDGVFSNGALHWMVKRSSDHPGLYSICALHLGTLEYSLVPLPNHAVFWLGVLDGCLCVFSGDRDDISLLVMKEYGLKESWTKLFHYHTEITPLAYTEDGNELLFVTPDEVMSYEFKTRSFKRVISTEVEIFKSVVCIPSLVFPLSDEELALCPRRSARLRRRTSIMPAHCV